MSPHIYIPIFWRLCFWLQQIFYEFFFHEFSDCRRLFSESSSRLRTRQTILRTYQHQWSICFQLFRFRFSYATIPTFNAHQSNHVWTRQWSKVRPYPKSGGGGQGQPPPPLSSAPANSKNCPPSILGAYSRLNLPNFKTKIDYTIFFLKLCINLFIFSDWPD